MATKSYNGLDREEIVSRLKAIVAENGDVRFTIPDNCPGDGWDGILCKDGLYVEGEFFKYSVEQDVNDANFLQEILDIVELTKIDWFIALKIKSNN